MKRSIKQLEEKEKAVLPDQDSDPDNVIKDVEDSAENKKHKEFKKNKKLDDEQVVKVNMADEIEIAI